MCKVSLILDGDLELEDPTCSARCEHVSGLLFLWALRCEDADAALDVLARLKARNSRCRAVKCMPSVEGQ